MVAMNTSMFCNVVQAGLSKSCTRRGLHVNIKEIIMVYGSTPILFTLAHKF